MVRKVWRISCLVQFLTLFDYFLFEKTGMTYPFERFMSLSVCGGRLAIGP